MEHRLIFVSCGQRAQEKELGKAIATLINETEGFEAYYADTVQDLDGLKQHIFDALRRCAGAIVFLQPRGSVHLNDEAPFVRSSVWVNQEVAILAYRQFFEGRRIPVLAFRDDDVTLEGAMTAFILNPKHLLTCPHFLYQPL